MNDATDAVQSLLELLHVEEIDTDLYRGAASPEEPGRVFGGQVVAQALASAGRGIADGWSAHSLHAYFLRAGDTTRPVIYRVARDFDGGSFANRRVVAMQGGQAILNLAASFQRPEDGLAHEWQIPDTPPPEACPSLVDTLATPGSTMPEAMLQRLAPFDIRVCGQDADGQNSSGMPRQHLWFRLARPAEVDHAMARVILAYASDFALVTTAALPHRLRWFSPNVQGASLDHAVWFHETPRIEEWLLYTMDSPWSGHARGFARGAIFSQSGQLVASVAQEGLMRQRTPKAG